MKRCKNQKEKQKNIDLAFLYVKCFYQNEKKRKYTNRKLYKQLFKFF